MSFFEQIVFAFVPLFVAIDAIGTVPLVISVTQDFNPPERWRVIRIAMLTALAVGLGFLFLGEWVLALLGIKVAHFAIGGGLVLLVLSVRDIATGKMMDAPAREELAGVVPIGTPLTVGPATITTLLLLVQQYSHWVVLLAFGLNVAVALVVFLQSNLIVRVLGVGGVRAVSKVASLLLAAIAVSLIFRGLPEVLPGLG